VGGSPGPRHPVRAGRPGAPGSASGSAVGGQVRFQGAGRRLQGGHQGPQPTRLAADPRHRHRQARDGTAARVADRHAHRNQVPLGPFPVDGEALRGAGGPDWDAVPAAYQAVRVEHCRRVQRTARAWGELWHLDGERRLRRDAVLREVDPYGYAFTDWVYGPTALFPDEEPAMFEPSRWPPPG
jgi:hypothetical protein